MCMSAVVVFIVLFREAETAAEWEGEGCCHLCLNKYVMFACCVNASMLSGKEEGKRRVATCWGRAVNRAREGT